MRPDLTQRPQASLPYHSAVWQRDPHSEKPLPGVGPRQGLVCVGHWESVGSLIGRSRTCTHQQRLERPILGVQPAGG